MKIRIISDLHIDVNSGYPFRLTDTKTFTVICGDIGAYFNKTSKYIPLIYFSSVTSVLFQWLKNGAQESTEDMARMLSSVLNIDLLDKKNSVENENL